MTRMFQIVGAAALLIGAAGCVPQEKYNALKLDRDGLADQLVNSQLEASNARKEANSYKDQLAQILANGGNLQALVTNLTGQNAALQTQLDELNRKYTDALNRVGSNSPLPAALTNELTAFANAYPDLVDFDSARGIVKFKSDVTFGVGDATLTSGAKTVIDKFATILNSAGASQYELIVAGHTDNQRVSNPKTIAAGHKDNWYLSAHRAIAVSEELISHGTSAQRIGVTGYADQRPAASNASSAGQQQNRRVEVIILPTTVRGGAVAGTKAPAVAKPAANQNKDAGSANTDIRPILNK